MRIEFFDEHGVFCVRAGRDEKDCLRVIYAVMERVGICRVKIDGVEQHVAYIPSFLHCRRK